MSNTANSYRPAGVLNVDDYVTARVNISLTSEFNGERMFPPGTPFRITGVKRISGNDTEYKLETVVDSPYQQCLVPMEGYIGHYDIYPMFGNVWLPNFSNFISSGTRAIFKGQQELPIEIDTLVHDSSPYTDYTQAMYKVFKVERAPQGHYATTHFIHVPRKKLKKLIGSQF